MVAPPPMMPPGPPAPPGMPPGGPPGLMMPPPPAPPPFVAAREERATARLKPFDLPPYEKKERPTQEWLLAQKKARIDYWKARNEEIDRDLDYYYQEDAVEEKVTGEGGEEVLRRVTPTAMADKLARLAARQKDKIKVTPRSQAQPYVDAAQDVEDWLYDARRQIDDKHTARLNAAYAHDEAWYAAVCGVICSRTYLDPGDDFPFCVELFDPRCCYPRAGDGKNGAMLADMLYYEETDKQTLLQTNPRLAERIDGLEGKEETETVKVLWYEDACWSVILVDDGEPAYIEHGYGFCPWAVALAGSTPLRDVRSRRHVGAGVIRKLRKVFAYEDRFWSQLATMLAKQANPAYITTFNSDLGGKPKEMDLSPGAPNAFDTGKGEGYTPIQDNTRIDMVAMIAEMLKVEVSRAGVDDMLLGGSNQGVASGFQFNIMRFNAEDVLQPATKAIITHRQAQHRLLLMLVLVAERDGLLQTDAMAEPGEPQTGVLYRRPDRGAGYNRRQPTYIYSVLTPESIHMHGLANEVVLDNMTPQDRAQLAQVVSMLIAQKVISRRTGWEWLGIDDPDLENLELIREGGTIEDPDLLREYWLPLALKALSPEFYSWWVLRQQQIQDAQMMQMGMGMGGPPPEGAPAARPGLDSTILPPEMQAVTGIPGAGDAGAQAAEMAELPMLGPLV